MSIALSGSHALRTAAIALTNAADFALIETITVPESQRGKPLLISGAVGAAGGLAGLKLTMASLPGGTHVPLAIDADFNTATALIPFSTTSPHQAPAGGVFAFQLAAAPPEIAIHAKKAIADTTVQLSGSILG
jgi:hypothetical protein